MRHGQGCEKAWRRGQGAATRTGVGQCGRGHGGGTGGVASGTRWHGRGTVTRARAWRVAAPLRPRAAVEDW